MLVRRCLKDAGDPKLTHYEEVCSLYRKKFDEDPLYKVVPYEGIMETLGKLQNAGVKLAVCSNKPHEAAVKVIARMFEGCFDLVIGQSDRIRRKPSPDGPLKVAVGVWSTAFRVHVHRGYKNRYGDRYCCWNAYSRSTLGIQGQRRTGK